MNPPSATAAPLSSCHLPVSSSRFDAVALQLHLRRCALARGRWFSMRCLAEGLHAFLAPRVVTTLTAVTGVFWVVSLLY